MELIAIGKWSKADKRWRTVMALRRPSGIPSSSAKTRSERGKPARQRPQPRSDT